VISRKLAAVLATVTISAATATALFLGGSHSSPPASPTLSPTVGVPLTGYAVVPFYFPAAPGATGYRVWLDGFVTGVTNYVGATFPLKCGVKHRMNYQPFNNAGVAKLVAPPVYVTPDCKGATS
jgi:hypothetical protein